MTARLWRVAAHEYRTNVNKRSFFFGAVGIPLLIFAILGFVLWISIRTEEDSGRIGGVGVVDQAAVLAAVPAAMPSADVAMPQGWRMFPDEAAARAALDADAASPDAVGAYFILPEDYIQTGNVRLVARTGTPDALQDDLDALLRASLARSLMPEVAARLQDPTTLSLRTLDTGRVIQDSGIIAVFLLPFVFVLVFTIASASTSSYLMSSVVEEKSSRVMEILVTSIRPMDLLGGKVLGLGAVGLTMLAIWAAMGAVGLLLGRGSQVLAGISIPADLLIVTLIYFVLSYFLTGSIMAGIGAVVGSEQESRQIAGLISMLNVIPFFFFVNFLTDSNGALPVILTLIPFTAPLSALLRLGYGAVPAWQLIASFAILALTTLVAIWASARIFRWSILMYGKRPSLRQVLRAVRTGGMGTTATGDRAG